MKCEICSKALAKTFLEKLKGTFVKDSKGKPHPVCFECQKAFNGEKPKIMEKLER